MDEHCRKEFSWQLSNILEARFCIEALQDAYSLMAPEVYNSDQGCQFTSEAFTSLLNK